MTDILREMKKFFSDLGLHLELGIKDSNLGACTGEWITPDDENLLVSVNPSDGEPIASIVQADEAAYEKVVAAAAAAFETWRMMPAPARGEVVRELGNELRAGARAATLLVNVTNDAWYGRSVAAWQHNQIAAMRALELGRPMLRATNTGVTAAIGHDGRVAAELPWFTRGILEAEVAGRSGTTPYLRFGDALPLVVTGFVLAGVLLADRRDTARSAARRESR